MATHYWLFIADDFIRFNFFLNFTYFTNILNVSLIVYKEYEGAFFQKIQRRIIRCDILLFLNHGKLQVDNRTNSMVLYDMGKHTEFVAYYGKVYTVEWYFNSKGVMPAISYFNKLMNKRQDKLLYLIKRIGDYGIINNKQLFRNEGDGIYAFKPKPDRFLCFFFKEKKIIVTNGFEKRQDKLPKPEKRKALAMKQDYGIRVNEGKYYE